MDIFGELLGTLWEIFLENALHNARIPRLVRTLMVLVPMCLITHVPVSLLKDAVKERKKWHIVLWALASLVFVICIISLLRTVWTD